jgi:putative protein-disulfide isomerase
VSEARVPRLLYVADPLCSWCYGFGPELARLLERRPDLALDLLMGGLRPGNTEPMSEAFRGMLREHWVHVAEVSGLPFSETIFDAPGFVYDTEPPCRAVVTARSLDPTRAFALMKEIQSAFYRDGVDVTRGEALADAAQRCGYPRAAFLAALESPALRAATQADFARSRSLGVSGFPTLALSLEGGLYLVASGYAQAAVLEERIERIVERLRSSSVEGARNADAG